MTQAVLKTATKRLGSITSRCSARRYERAAEIEPTNGQRGRGTDAETAITCMADTMSRKLKGPLKYLLMPLLGKNQLAITQHMYASIGRNLDNTHRGQI